MVAVGTGVTPYRDLRGRYYQNSDSGHPLRGVELSLIHI